MARFKRAMSRMRGAGGKAKKALSRLRSRAANLSKKSKMFMFMAIGLPLLIIGYFLNWFSSVGVKSAYVKIDKDDTKGN